jgi:hypothetical protein
MKTVQRWISVLVVAVAALAGSFLFNLTIHRDAMARESNASQAAPKWQITAVPINNGYHIFMVNQETGETYINQGQGGGFSKLTGPLK